MTAEAQQRHLVLPGDHVDPSAIPSHPKKALRLGPGLRYVPPGELVPTVAGQLATDPRKNSIWVEYHGGRVSSSFSLLLASILSYLSQTTDTTNRPLPSPTQYVPAAGDLVIGTVAKTSGEYLYVSLSGYTSPAALPQLAFEGASKKTRPNLSAGALVYARVALANRHMDPELECVSPATGKADGLGPLVGGMLFDVSLGLARRLLMRRAADDGRVVVLDELAAAGLAFETAVGRNGRVWVNSNSGEGGSDAKGKGKATAAGDGSPVASAAIKTILLVGRALKETDERNLTVDQQKKLVRKLIKDMS